MLRLSSSSGGGGLVSSVLSYVGLGPSGVNISSVPVHDIETLKSARDRRLKHLIKLNHANHSILYHNRRFHNHTPHHLGSAYLLNCSADHLNKIYEHTSEHDGLPPWEDSPSEIALHDYRDFLGKREYQRAWVDFFEDQLIEHSYSWPDVAKHFLLATGSKSDPNPLPMFSCLTAGLGHPLIHLGYAYELNSREIAMEALGLAATCYDPHLASLLTQPVPNPQPATPDIFLVFSRLAADTRLNSLFTSPGRNLEAIYDSPETLATILEHFASWTVNDPTTQFNQSQHLAALLLLSTAPTQSPPGHGYDFFLVHLLTTSHAVRILIPFLPPQHHVTLVKEWLLITMLIYVAQLCPKLDSSWLEKYDTKGKGWDDVDKVAIEGQWNMDAHFVKGCRALKAASETWGDEDKWFLKCAVRFSDEFDGWGGFSEEDMEQN